jgi:hypothetical protein
LHVYDLKKIVARRHVHAAMHEFTNRSMCNGFGPTHMHALTWRTNLGPKRKKQKKKTHQTCFTRRRARGLLIIAR